MPALDFGCCIAVSKLKIPCRTWLIRKPFRRIPGESSRVSRTGRLILASCQINFDIGRDDAMRGVLAASLDSCSILSDWRALPLQLSNYVGSRIADFNGCSTAFAGCIDLSHTFGSHCAGKCRCRTCCPTFPTRPWWWAACPIRGFIDASLELLGRYGMNQPDEADSDITSIERKR